MTTILEKTAREVEAALSSHAEKSVVWSQKCLQIRFVIFSTNLHLHTLQSCWTLRLLLYEKNLT